MLASLMTFVYGCASTNKVVFVTSTEIGMGADAKVGNVNIGYDRNEMVVGPVYPETGDTPPVYARLESNLKVFSPEVKQLYATGHAAEIATNKHASENSSHGLYGARKVMMFGTTTNFGLKIHFSGNTPDSMNLGYKRKEMSVIPLKDKQPTESDPDKYASVIAGLGLSADATSFSGAGVKLSQFIATGTAAESVAKNASSLFNDEAVNALEQAGATAKGIDTAKKRQEEISDILGRVVHDGEVDKSALSELFFKARVDVDNDDRKFVEQAADADDLRSRLEQTRTMVDKLHEALQ
jgi:hypothetical protein